jgi:tetratricopeptide (TPR) repeat protein
MEAAFTATKAPYASDAWTALAQHMDDYSRQWVEQRSSACESMIRPDDESSQLGEARIACLERQFSEVQELLGVFGAADADVVRRSAVVASQLPGPDDCQDPALLARGRKSLHGPLLDAVAKIDQKLYRARALVKAGKYADAKDASQRALELAREAGHPPSTARALLASARAHQRLDDSERARTLAQEALLAGEEAGEDTVAARSQVLLASIAQGRGDLVEAENLALQAGARIRRLELGSDAAHEATLALITIRMMQKRLDDAFRLAQEALLVHERSGKRDDGWVARLHSMMGNARYRQGKSTDAQVHFKRVLELQRASYGPSHPDVATALLNVGSMAAELGDADTGQKRTEEALAILEQGPPSRALAMTLYNLGETLREQGDNEGALTMARRSLEVKTALGGQALRDVYESHAGIGHSLRALGRHAEALEAFERAVETGTSAMGPDHPRLLWPYYGLGLTRQKLGDVDGAIEAFQRGLAIGLGSENTDPPRLGMTRFALAKTLVARDPERAKELARAAREDFRDTYVADRIPEIDAWLAQREDD